MKKPVLDCAQCMIKSLGVFSSLNGEYLDQLNMGKIVHDYEKNQAIFYEGSKPFGVYCIFSGKVKLYKKGKAGREQIVRMTGPGNLLGYRSVLADEFYAATAEAIEDSRICFIEKASFLNLLQKNPEIMLNLLKKMSRELGQAENRYLSVIQKPVKKRLAEILYQLYRSYPADDKDGVLGVDLSREEVAELAGMTRETAVRLLSDFQKQNIIKVEGRKISILNIPELLKMADLES